MVRSEFLTNLNALLSGNQSAVVLIEGTERFFRDPDTPDLLVLFSKLKNLTNLRPKLQDESNVIISFFGLD